ncbi:hypothetical protein K2X96_01280 [Patescibacteria group bacterium]|nr:hypothetical protein [Patescibacteria group bacterium]
MASFFKNIYEFMETVPDRLYPFACEIEGRLVRGRRSYMQALDRAVEMYGPHHFGYKLIVYRTAFHFLGSVFFIVCAALISQKLLGSEMALYVLLGAAIIALFVQEFYSHPKRYGQSRQKGILDWLTWVIPMMVYISFHTF